MELREFEGELALAVDCWSSPNHHAFMSVTVTWLRKTETGGDELTTRLLDFIELPCSHSGRNMAEAMGKCLEEYGIANKVSKNCDGDKN